MLKVEQVYPSDLSNEQWEYIRRFIPRARVGGRPRSTNVRKIFDAIVYINRTGCAWRYLPRQFPPWQTVYMYYADWKVCGVLRKIHECLVRKVRVSANRKNKPSTLIVDSQSTKAQWGERRGVDGFKKVRGRKRNIFVDTLGLIHAVKVDAADQKDHSSAIEMLNSKILYFPTTAKAGLKAFYADGGYKAFNFQDAVEKHFKVRPTLNISTHHKDPSKERKILIDSNLKPKRWIVERTFAWFNSFRRLTRDYERLTSGSEAMIQIAMIQLMLNRLTKPKETYSRWH